MKKAAVVFWTGTGNTEQMASAIAEGIAQAGGLADIIEAETFGSEQMGNYDVFAFGCPAMGAEVLEESVFDPMFTSIEGDLDGKTVALFGSYGWGDGEWMREWTERTEGDGAVVVHGEGLMVNGEPSASDLDICRQLGKDLIA